MSVAMLATKNFFVVYSTRTKKLALEYKIYSSV